MKNTNLEILVSILSVLLVFFLRGVYLYYDADFTIIQVFNKVIYEVANLLVIIVPGMVAAFIVILVSNQIRKKRR
ncbi:MAG: hypothetical protein U0Z26_10125 [Anaerolineales bacterium]